MLKRVGFVVAAATVIWLAGCATTPDTPAERQSLEARANATIQTMTARDPGLQSVLDQAYGYAVFPEIGKGGALVGGAHGIGVVYEQGRPVGYVELNQGSIGAQLGAQTFSELIVFRNQPALQRLKAGNFDLGAGASAVALTAGAAAATRFEGGVAVFVMPQGGLMVDVSVSGQQLNYEPRG